MVKDPSQHIPTHGPTTGSKVVWTSLEYESGDELIQSIFPPQEPGREQNVYDEDGECNGTRILSNAEYEKAMELYQKAKAEWDRTGGIGYVKMHPDRIELEIRCEDGSMAKGIWNDVGEKWVWIEERWNGIEKNLPPNTILWSDGTTENVDDILKRIPRRKAESDG